MTVRKAIEQSGVRSEEIAGVSLSGHGKGLYLVGYDGKPSYLSLIHIFLT